MSHPARPLRFLIVSPDIGLLHDLSWMLSAVGYTVVTSKDLSDRAAWRQFCETDFIVFDGRSISAPTPATLAHHSDNPIYRFFLYDPSATQDLAAWFAAGANDALRVPVSRGELLVRTRVGARMLEFENRLRSQSIQKPIARNLFKTWSVTQIKQVYYLRKIGHLGPHLAHHVDRFLRRALSGERSIGGSGPTRGAGDVDSTVRERQCTGGLHRRRNLPDRAAGSSGGCGPRHR